MPDETSSGDFAALLHAHSLEGRPRGEWETLAGHSRRAACAAERRASPFGGGGLALLQRERAQIGSSGPGWRTG